MILRIASGTSPGSLTTVIDFINDDYGIHLAEWRPSIAQVKGGGVWSDSPMARGRKLRYYQDQNIVDEIKFSIVGENPDSAIGYLNDLLDALENARRHWKSAQYEPYWLIARGPRETNARYSMISLGAVPNYEDQYRDVFVQADGTAIMEDMSVVIEHGDWIGTESALAIGYDLSWNGDYYGNVSGNTSTRAYSSTIGDVFVANYAAYNNITHIFHQDGDGTFSSNLIDSTPPYDLLAPAKAAGGSAVVNYLYIGISTAETDYGPFGCVVFNLDVDAGFAANMAGGSDWEYNKDGVGWTTIIDWWDHTDSVLVQDGATNKALTTDGIGSLVIIQPEDWQENSVNSVTAFWIRLKYTFDVDAGTGQVVQQIDRHPYIPSWNSFKIPQASLQAAGPASLLKMTVKSLAGIREGGTADGTAANSKYELPVNKVYVAARPTSAGSNFRTNLPAHNDFLPSWVSATYPNADSDIDDWDSVGGTISGTYRMSALYTGWALVNVNGTSGSWETNAAVRWTFTNDADYRGETYHIFARVLGGDAVVDSLIFRVALGWGGKIVSYSDEVWSDSQISSYESGGRLVDFGEIRIPSDLYGNYYIEFQYKEMPSATGADFEVVELIMMPTSYYYNLFYGPYYIVGDEQDLSFTDTYLVVDSLDFSSPDNVPKLLYDDGTGNIEGPYFGRLPGPIVIDSNEEMEIFFAFDNAPYLGSDTLTSEASLHNMVHTVSVSAIPIYFGSRGSS